MDRRALLLDLDGVLYVEDEPVDGARDAVAELRGRGLSLQAVVVGDIGGALGAGLAAILVRTGKYRDDALRDSGVEPSAVVDSIADVPALLEAIRGSG